LTIYPALIKNESNIYFNISILCFATLMTMLTHSWWTMVLLVTLDELWWTQVYHPEENKKLQSTLPIMQWEILLWKTRRDQRWATPNYTWWDNSQI